MGLTGHEGAVGAQRRGQHVCRNPWTRVPVKCIAKRKFMYRSLSAIKGLVILLAAIVISVPTQAQELRGRVQGTVTDVSGSVIPAASVTLLNINTNISTAGQSNETGRYLFNGVLEAVNK